MRICRIAGEKGSVLAAVLEDEGLRPLRSNRVINLRSTRLDYIDSWKMLLQSADPANFYNSLRALAERSDVTGFYPEYEMENKLLAPLDTQEVWAAGVTYWRSREARMEESDRAANLYDMVYEAERPELFFKATPHRVVPPGGEIGIRADSKWSVPEPELAVLYDANLRPLGYTICNDVTARDIEGANPLYLPQAKVYTASCALGPTVLLVDNLEDKPYFRIECVVYRNGVEVFQGGGTTAQLKRTLPELTGWLRRANTFPGGVVLSTGTSIVPPDDFTLQAGDRVEIVVENIGTLSNTVKVVE
jgi:2-dehydro-3-deoxy-D-arabinonate dehydratase